MALLWFVLLINLHYALSQNETTLHYEAYTGALLSDDEYAEKVAAGLTQFCVFDLVEGPCDETEFRRIDGSCNNLNYPTRGAGKTPYVRMLPASYDQISTTEYEPRLSVSGAALPLARKIRTTLLAEGLNPDQSFTHLVADYLVFAATDITLFQDTFNYMFTRPYCCLEAGKNDSMCVPNEIPEDDPVHRFSGHRCINMTRPYTYQIRGCRENTTVPERLNMATPTYDLSIMYGSYLANVTAKGRLFTGGLLKSETDDDGREWPPFVNTTTNNCFLNDRANNETKCFDTPDGSLNGVVGITLLGTWYWRNHNRIATELAALNPSWSDDLLFYTARDINIATHTQILYYELFPALMGYENMIADEIISESSGFREVYDDTILPQLSIEYITSMRWGHTIQEGTIKLFDPNGTALNEWPIMNLTFRTGFLYVDNNIDYITQGMFRTAGAAFDNIVDPDVGERGLGGTQMVMDLMTNDLAKNRYFGFMPYVDYVETCTGTIISDFSDLIGMMANESIELLQEVYEYVEDIDLLAGLWVEFPVPGGMVPPTFYCIIADQMKRTVVSDRHWYERADRPHAFTEDQLLQIRNATIARLLCDIGDKVTEIQSSAFERISDMNPLMNCEDIPAIDLSYWKDSSVLTCESD